MQKTMHGSSSIQGSRGNPLKHQNEAGEFVKRIPTFSLRYEGTLAVFFNFLYILERESSMHNNHLISVS
jgi:hypothetical protein